MVLHLEALQEARDMSRLPPQIRVNSAWNNKQTNEKVGLLGRRIFDEKNYEWEDGQII